MMHGLPEILQREHKAENNHVCHQLGRKEDWAHERDGTKPSGKEIARKTGENLENDIASEGKALRAGRNFIPLLLSCIRKCENCSCKDL